MENFISQALMFLLLTGSLLAILLGYVFYKSDFNKDKFKENWIKSEGKDKPYWKGIVSILGVPLLIAAILYAVNVKSEEIKWFDEATVYVGLDYTQNPSPLCRDYGTNDQITSNLGFTQSIIKKGEMNVNFKYTHHSCAVSADKNSYDAAGIMLEWTIN